MLDDAPAASADTAATTVLDQASGATTEGLNATVVAHLRNKAEAPAGRELFATRKGLKADYDYYFAKVGSVAVSYTHLTLPTIYSV